jgi:antitoxin component of MazEF toxin-antitoxin module
VGRGQVKYTLFSYTAPYVADLVSFVYIVSTTTLNILEHTRGFRMLTAKVRKTGNSYVVTIPREELDRLDLQEGEIVGIEVRKLDIRPQMSPEVRAAFDKVVKEYAEDIEYLGR